MSHYYLLIYVVCFYCLWYNSLMFIFFIIITILYIILLSSGLSQKKGKTCDQNKMLHEWEYKNREGNEYIVCKRCKLLPGGSFEEGE